MTLQQAIEVLKTEIQCVQNINCDRSECKNCHLVMQEQDILEAYEMAIEALEGEKLWNEEHWLLEKPKAKEDAVGDVPYGVNMNVIGWFESDGQKYLVNELGVGFAFTPNEYTENMIEKCKREAKRRGIEFHEFVVGEIYDITQVLKHAHAIPLSDVTDDNKKDMY